MGRIDRRIADIRQERFAAAASAEDARERLRQRLAPSAQKVFETVRQATSGDSNSWAINSVLVMDVPCVEVWRKDRSPRQQLAKFTFSETDQGIAVHIGNEFRLMKDGGARWAASKLVDHAAASFMNNEVAMHPWLKFGLWSIAALVALPFAIQLVIVAASAVLPVIAVLFGAALVAAILTGG